MIDPGEMWPWLAVALLGAFHGLNPGMGWLFAVALGLQERKGRSVVTALGPIALGHACAIALIALPVGLLGLVISPRAMLALGGLTLIAFAGVKVASRFRHPRWVGMRVGGRDLVFWSFLMATTHGAGLMLAPAVALLAGPDLGAAALAADHADHLAHVSHAAVASDIRAALTPALAGTALHTGSMFLVMGVIAVAVYQFLGVELLRRTWINLDFIWAGALASAGLTSLALSLTPMLGG